MIQTKIKETQVYQLLKKLLKRNSQQNFTHTIHTIALHQWKTIYFDIPKVASSSLKKVCADLLEIEILPGKTTHSVKYPQIKAQELEKYKDYYKFCFVRNPWDRLVSCYNEKIKKDSNYNQYGYINGLHPQFLKYGTFKAGMSFEEFVNAVLEIPDSQADGHFRSQHTFVADNKGKLLVDFVGKFESLNEDFRYVCEKNNISGVTLPHILKMPHKNYKEYYTDNLKKLVKKRYAKDIKLFKYEF